MKFQVIEFIYSFSLFLVVFSDLETSYGKNVSKVSSLTSNSTLLLTHSPCSTASSFSTSTLNSRSDIYIFQSLKAVWESVYRLSTIAAKEHVNLANTMFAGIAEMLPDHCLH
jgi:hypothetical protein